ncbi:hypothetical protein ABMA27_006963 [Loxostege sticticalis]|uniref:Farnesoic acid O-methyl transferase domain-containing protein n=1 Tax=Loxostege sticticalis TaxID=481309 RepID=A0ABR3IL55_LOXSC
MGEIIEKTTVPDGRRFNVFYKVSAGGINFEAKTDTFATIGLSPTPGGDNCVVWVVIGYAENVTYIKKKSSHRFNTVRTPDILNADEYRRFWLSWNNGVVQLGQGDHRTPIISEPYEGNLSYVTFVSQNLEYYRHRNANIVHWRIELPPTCTLEKPIAKPVTTGKLEWVRADSGSIPNEAIVGGYDNEPLYIIRAHHNRFLYPGKYARSKRAAHCSFLDRVIEKTEFEVLCGCDYSWKTTSKCIIPSGAVVGGYDNNMFRELYVGRVRHDGHLIPGMVDPSHGDCRITVEDRTIAYQNYEILVEPSRCANKVLLQTYYYQRRN